MSSLSKDDSQELKRIFTNLYGVDKAFVNRVMVALSTLEKQNSILRNEIEALKQSKKECQGKC